MREIQSSWWNSVGNSLRMQKTAEDLVAADLASGFCGMGENRSKEESVT